ncbi:hypothetical protein KQX54_002208 [Cotesia glomerata]|uniref:Uncharacterized protein n=1 Tax=Cotesia glomerata TaxID=32391 RepID=A0AAV7I4I5_COTGL|nr:hypothetical protein KQX54_002208 [Cotesia glomerata]
MSSVKKFVNVDILCMDNEDSDSETTLEVTNVPHTTCGPIYKNGHLYWRFLSYVLEFHADVSLENLPKSSKKRMLTTLNGGRKYKESFEIGFDFMLAEYSDIIQKNLKLLKRKKVDIILVAPEVQGNIPVLLALVDHLSAYYMNELNTSFSSCSVPRKSLIKRIESSFTEIVHPDPKLYDFIFSTVIKYMVSLKTDVPLYSIPTLGSYNHRDLFSWLKKWDLDDSEFRKPSEQQEFLSSSYKPKLEAFKPNIDKSFSKSKDLQPHRLRSSEQKPCMNHGASTSVTSLLDKSAESSIEIPDRSYTEELKNIYRNRNQLPIDGNSDNNTITDASKIKGKRTPNIQIKRSKQNDDSDELKKGKKASIVEDTRGLFIKFSSLENLHTEKSSIKKCRNIPSPEFGIPNPPESRKKRIKRTVEENSDIDILSVEDMSSETLPAARKTDTETAPLVENVSEEKVFYDSDRSRAKGFKGSSALKRKMELAYSPLRKKEKKSSKYAQNTHRHPKSKLDKLLKRMVSKTPPVKQVSGENSPTTPKDDTETVENVSCEKFQDRDINMEVTPPVIEAPAENITARPESDTDTSSANGSPGDISPTTRKTDSTSPVKEAPAVILTATPECDTDTFSANDLSGENSPMTRKTDYETAQLVENVSGDKSPHRENNIKATSPVKGAPAVILTATPECDTDTFSANDLSGENSPMTRKTDCETAQLVENVSGDKSPHRENNFKATSPVKGAPAVIWRIYTDISEARPRSSGLKRD